MGSFTSTGTISATEMLVTTTCGILHFAISKDMSKRESRWKLKIVIGDFILVDTHINRALDEKKEIRSGAFTTDIQLRQELVTNPSLEISISGENGFMFSLECKIPRNL